MTATARCQPISFSISKRSDPGTSSGKDAPNVLAKGRSASRTKTPVRHSRRHSARSRSKRREREGREGRRRRRHSRARRSSSSSARKAASPRAKSPEKASEAPPSEAPMVTEEPSVTETVAPPRAELGLPFLSFREYVLTQPIQVAEAKTPQQFYDEYQEYDADHRKDCQERYWTAHKEKAILSDAYHPDSLRRQLSEREVRSQQRLHRFLESLEGGHFENLRLRYEVAAGGQGMDGAGHIALPTKQLREILCVKDQEHLFMLEEVPREVSIWDIHDQLSHLSGFQDAYLTRDLAEASKAAFVHFYTGSDLQAALSSLGTSLAVGDVELRIKEVDKQAEEGQERESQALIVPGERVEEDLKLASQLAQALDAAVGIPEVDAAKAAAALAAASDAERRLDLHILYLRRVHYCCFYSGEWCSDPHELCRRAGAGSLRQVVAASDAAACSDWASKHCERVRALIARAAAAQPPPPRPCPGEEPLQSKWLQACEALAKKEAEERFRCTRCAKLFRGVNFVQKHVGKCHPEVVKELEESIMQEQMKEAFFRDHQAGREAQRAVIRGS